MSSHVPSGADDPVRALVSLGADSAVVRALVSLGADSAVVRALGDLPGTPGRVDRVERGRVSVAGPTPSFPRVPPGLAVAVGDWVTVDGTGDRLSAVLPRSTVLGRTDVVGSADHQVLAVNVTHVLVVVPASAPVRLTRLERWLTLVWSSGAQPVVVITKADAGDSELPAVAAAAPGCEVVAVSAVSGAGMPVLQAICGPGTTSALLGASGAGKSTLVNALARRAVMATQDVRADGRGRHTTVTRQLVPLPSGGVVIDTPGLRALALWSDDGGLERTFADLEDLAADCRFSDCAHDGEPDCAVVAAIDAGVLDARRLQSWRKLGRELRRQELRQDARARADAARQWRRLHQPTRRARP